MSLNIDMTTTEIAAEGRSAEIMEVLAFAMMFVGVRALTNDKAVAEFERRVRIYCEAFGQLWSGDADAFYSLLPKCIGTHSNASTMTALQFRRHVLDRKWAELVRKAKAKEVAV